MKAIRLKIAAVVLVILIGGLGFLFLTIPGLNFQWGIAVRRECDPYKRLLLYISSARMTYGGFHAVAAEFKEFALKDLITARQMADRAIQLQPNEAAYYMSRGQINMQAQHYAEAKTDFEMGLYCWRDHWGQSPTQAEFTNGIVKATRYLQAWESLQRDLPTEPWLVNVNTDIQQGSVRPAPYWFRGRRNMLAGHYAEAKADFGMALRYQRHGDTIPTQGELTNALSVAIGYLEASKKVAEMHIDDSQGGKVGINLRPDSITK